MRARNSRQPRGTAQSQTKPNVFFVGNLSFFCKEQDLFDLFNQYGYVEHVVIVHNDANTHSLMFGFVTMRDAEQARAMEKLFDGHLFQGRRLKVAISDKKYDPKQPVTGVQVHVTFSSFFDQSQDFPKPTEMFLLRQLIRFAPVLDVCVKEYIVSKTQNAQKGYGFVTVASMEQAQLLVSIFREGVTADGFTLVCALTHQSMRAYNKPSHHQQQQQHHQYEQRDFADSLHRSMSEHSFSANKYSGEENHPSQFPRGFNRLEQHESAMHTHTHSARSLSPWTHQEEGFSPFDHHTALYAHNLNNDMASAHAQSAFFERNALPSHFLAHTHTPTPTHDSFSPSSFCDDAAYSSGSVTVQSSVKEERMV